MTYTKAFIALGFILACEAVSFYLADWSVTSPELDVRGYQFMLLRGTWRVVTPNNREHAMDATTAASIVSFGVLALLVVSGLRQRKPRGFPVEPVVQREPPDPQC